MKKVLLAFTLALATATAIQSMQQQPQQSSYWNYLPQGVQQKILEYQNYWNLLPNGVKEYIMSYFATTPSGNVNSAVYNKPQGTFNSQPYQAYPNQATYPNTYGNKQPALNYNAPATNTNSSVYDQIKALFQGAMGQQQQ